MVADVNSFSIRSFVAPYTLSGATALSVLTATASPTPASLHASITFCDPTTLVFIDSNGLYSIPTTSFSAAV